MSLTVKKSKMAGASHKLVEAFSLLLVFSKVWCPSRQQDIDICLGIRVALAGNKYLRVLV